MRHELVRAIYSLFSSHRPPMVGIIARVSLRNIMQSEPFGGIIMRHEYTRCYALTVRQRRGIITQSAMYETSLLLT